MFYKLRLQIQRIEGALYFKIVPLTPPNIYINQTFILSGKGKLFQVATFYWNHRNVYVPAKVVLDVD